MTGNSAVPGHETSKVVVFFAHCIARMTIAMSFSLMSVFFVREAMSKGVSFTVSGLIFTAYPMTMLMAVPIMGKIIPKTGIKSIFLSGAVIVGTSNVLFGLLEHVHGTLNFTILCYLLRTSVGLGASAVITASSTFILQNFADNLGFSSGVLRTTIGIGNTLGPVFGGILYDAGGYGLPFYAMGTLICLNVPFIVYLWQEKESPEDIEHPKECSKLTYARMTKMPKVLLVTLSSVTFVTFQAFLGLALAPRLRGLGLSATEVGLRYMCCALVFAAVSPLIGFLAQKIPHKLPMIACGHLMNALLFGLIGPSALMTRFGLIETVQTTTGAFIMTGFSCVTIGIPSLIYLREAVMCDGISESLINHGQVAAWSNTSICAGQLIGAALSGLFLDKFGFVATINSIVTLSLVVAFVVLFFWIFEYVQNVKAENKLYSRF